MATSHLCNGKWRPGGVESCPKHKRISKKQPSVYRSGDEATPSESPSDSPPASSSDPE